MLAPNHCRLADPVVLGILGMEADCHLFAMAVGTYSSKAGFMTFMTRRSARSACCARATTGRLDTAIDILVARQRPLIMFPEGAITRHNDLIEEMMDGPSFIARQAAKRLQKLGKSGGVVIHPVAIRYAFRATTTT